MSTVELTASYAATTAAGAEHHESPDRHRAAPARQPQAVYTTRRAHVARWVAPCPRERGAWPGAAGCDILSLVAVRLERRQWVPEGTQPVWIGGTPGVGLEGRGIFSLVDGDEIRWTVAIRWSDLCCPFEGTLVWEQACCALVGAHAELYALDLSTGAVRGHWNVDYFTEFVPSPDAQTVFVLGALSVLALAPDLRMRWQSPEIAVDGIRFVRFSADELVVDAKMDPPGGWRRVALKLSTGRPGA